MSPLATLLALALPPRCPGCGGIVEADHRFCGGCWRSLRFVAPPWCAGCRHPFDHPRGDGARCASCLATPPRHAGVFAAVVYDDVSRRLALRLKHGRQIALAETAGRLMARHVPADTDLLVPVPLHRGRLWSRGFNQSALLAGTIARCTGVPHRADALVRHRATPLLRGLGARERAAAVRAAFRVRAGPALTGRRVVLVDDVYTSGATADACASALLRAGARSVAILVWARVLGDPVD